MIRALLLLLITLQPASAETARVLSGEHGDFTRLVIELPVGEEWTLGRTPAGYTFATTTAAQMNYDLGQVWQRIKRSRLVDLKADPERRSLELSLGCDCHVFPFEYQPGIIVLDIKPGPAPKESIFEAAVSPSRVDLPKGEPDGVTYEWFADAGESSPKSTLALPLPLATGAVSLTPLRDQLLEQIARGAAHGVIDMELPGKPATVPTAKTSTSWANVRIGEGPGILVFQPNGIVPEPRPDTVCAKAETLDLASWGNDRPPLDLVAETRDGLYGEFDQPREEAILHSVRLLLYLGFGAEAEQTSALVDRLTSEKALPLYRSMARLIDGESDPQTPFADMLDCPGPAALWAALARDRLPPGPGVNRDAILQSFQALPAHLRSYLGSSLAERFLARDDAEAVRIIRNAMDRAPNGDPAAVALLEAETELHYGDAQAALVHAETAVALDGERVDSLVALVESHFRELEPIDPKVAEVLMSLQGETEGTNEAAEMSRAVALALALSGQIEAAFAQEALSTDAEGDLWRVVRAQASDDDFMRHAILPVGSRPPVIDAEVTLAIGRRLLDLGFADAALIWFGPVSSTDAPELRLLAAAAESARGNDQTAADLIAGLQGAEAAALQAKVLERQGDVPAANAMLSANGDTGAAGQLMFSTQDSTVPDMAEPDMWRTVADFANPTADEPDQGLLSRGDKTVANSVASRDAIEALLSSVRSPVAK